MSGAGGIPGLADRLRGVQVGTRTDLEVTRQVFHDEVAYVVHDPITFVSHSFPPADYEVLVAIRQDEPLGRTFERLVEQGVLEARDEEDFFRLILSLHGMGFLTLPVSSHKALGERLERRRRARRRERMASFLFLRVPLVDPDAFLDRVAWIGRLLFSPLAVAVWTVLLLLATGTVMKRWHDVTAQLSGLFQLQGLATMWALLIGLKVIHELGHGLACKRYGGRVPEMGAFFIVFTPCAYVDATAAWGFSRRWERLVVNLAGMYTECFVAFAAVFVWAASDEGTLAASLSLKVALLASVTTVGFNVNPLMRFDGYYVLSDLLAIPNMQKRAFAVVKSSLAVALLGLRDPRDAAIPGPRGILAAYGIASSIYRVMLVLGIALLLVTRFGRLGVVLAGFYVATAVVWKWIGLLRWLCTADATRPVRARGVAWAAILALGLPSLAAFAPMPRAVVAEGVVESADRATVAVRRPGRLVEILRRSGEPVAAGDVVARLADPVLEGELAETRARVEAARLAERIALEAVDPSAARAPDGGAGEGLTALARARMTLAHERRVLADLERRVGELVVRAPAAGVLRDAPDDRDVGRFLAPGAVVAFVESGPLQLRAYVPAPELVASRDDLEGPVELRLATRPGEALDGRVVRVSSRGSRRIEPVALHAVAGGPIPVSHEGSLAAVPYFEVRVDFQGEPPAWARPGGRGRVRLEADPEPLGARLHRRVRAFADRLAAG